MQRVNFFLKKTKLDSVVLEEKASRRRPFFSAKPLQTPTELIFTNISQMSGQRQNKSDRKMQEF